MSGIKKGSMVFQLIELKKRQAALLFAAWDEAGDGQIRVQHLRPIICSLFPPPAVPEESDVPGGSLRFETYQKLLKRYRAATSTPRVRQCFYRSFKQYSAKASGLFDSYGAATAPTHFTLGQLQDTIDTLCQFDIIQRNEMSILARVPKEASLNDGERPTSEGDDDGRDAALQSDVVFTESDAFALLIGEVERVFDECVSAAAGPSSLSATKTLPIASPEICRFTAQVLDAPYSHYEAAALSAFFSSAFQIASGFQRNSMEENSSYIHCTHFLAAVFGGDA